MSKPRWIHFRLSTILWSITVLAILCCWAIDRRKLQNLEAERATLNAKVAALNAEVEALKKAFMKLASETTGRMPF